MSDNIQPSLDGHCNINETTFSWGLFICRLFTGSALIYLALGSLLYWQEFMVNTAILGIPYPMWTSFCLSGTELFIGLFLWLGWYTRFWAGTGLVISMACAIIFFVGQVNNVLAAQCLLLCATMSVFMWMGPGMISLDYKRRQRAAEKSLRG